MTIGVYQIRNTVTGACYVGASQHVEARLSGHRADLRRGDHCNRALQGDWTTYGEPSFVFTVLEAVGSLKTLAQRERAHAQRLAAEGVTLYSDVRLAGSGLLPDDTTEAQMAVMFTTRLRRGDVDWLNFIAKHRYPDDRRMVAQTVRDLIREEYARIQAKLAKAEKGA